MDQFFASQQIFEKARECAQKVNACFVDLVKQGCATHGPRATIRPSRLRPRAPQSIYLAICTICNTRVVFSIL